MAILPDDQQNIYSEETKFRAAVSEATMQKVGSAINFINNKYLLQKMFYLNGRYEKANGLPFLGVDGMDGYPYNIEVVDVMFFNNTALTSGTLELNIQYATSSGGAFTSIFTTTPKLTSAASNFAYVYASSPSTPTGMTKPVLTGTTVAIPARSAIRCSLVQKGVGGQNCGVIVFYKVVN